MLIRQSILHFLHFDVGAEADLDADPSSDVLDEASVRSLLRQGRRVDAISLVRSGGNLSLTEAVERVEGIEREMKAAK